jgi:hypothetical protein
MGEIELLGDRRNTGFCLMCGTDLILPWNDYQCCTKCTERLVGCRKTVENRKTKRTNVKKTIVHRGLIAKQRKPIGGIPRE